MAGEQVPFTQTSTHWILFAIMVPLSAISILMITIYHCHHYSKNELFKTQNNPNELKQLFLYKMMSIITVLMLICYAISKCLDVLPIFSICTNKIANGFSVFTYNAAKGFMYTIFIIRLHITYRNTKYAYNPLLLHIWGILTI